MKKYVFCLKNVIHSCAAQSSHENPPELDDYANPSRIYSPFDYVKPGQNLKVNIFRSLLIAL